MALGFYMHLKLKRNHLEDWLRITERLNRSVRLDLCRHGFTLIRSEVIARVVL